MAFQNRVGSLSVVQQARRQWQLVATWSSQNARSPQSTKLNIFTRLAVWVMAAAWRTAIGLALVVSFLVEASVALLRPISLFIDSLLGWLLLPLSAPLEAALTIPYLGRALGWLWRVILTLLWGVLHLLEVPLVMLSVMPRRHLRLWVLPTAVGDSPRSFDPASWLQALQVAAKILEREAKIQLVPIVPWEATGVRSAPELTLDQYSWFREAMLSVAESEFEVACNVEALKQDLGPLGGQIDRLALVGHPRGSYRRLSGWGAPIMAVSVSSVAGGELAGCSLGPLTDYITVRADLPVCLAHEIAHACNLGHHQAADNLMNPTCGGVHLTRWQVLLLRLSRHATYL